MEVIPTISFLCVAITIAALDFPIQGLVKVLHTNNNTIMITILVSTTTNDNALFIISESAVIVSAALTVS